jgi:hypothetical protein
MPATTADCKCANLKMEDVGLAKGSRSRPEVGGLRHESYFGFPCDMECAKIDRLKDPTHETELSDRNDKGIEGDGDGGWLSFLKDLPKVFFEPLVGVELISWRMMVGRTERHGPCPWNQRASDQKSQEYAHHPDRQRKG